MSRSVEGLSRTELTTLYTQFAPVVFRRARTLLGNEAEAWDAVQEVFERMLTHSSEFRGEARPTTWVYRITTNLCLNLIRARSQREAKPADEASAAEPTTSDSERTETRDLLRRWVEHLDEREAVVATLLFVDGLTQDEVADTLGLSRKTIGREVEAIRRKASALGALPNAEAQS